MQRYELFLYLQTFAHLFYLVFSLFLFIWLNIRLLKAKLFFFLFPYYCPQCGGDRLRIAVLSEKRIMEGGRWKQILKGIMNHLLICIVPLA